MIPKQAIEKATEGGYAFKKDGKLLINDGGNDPIKLPARVTAEFSDSYIRNVFVEEIALDKTFWQALGKALEWGDLEDIWNGVSMPAYKAAAHRFYDLILTGGDTEKFWKDLLT